MTTEPSAGSSGDDDTYTVEELRATLSKWNVRQQRENLVGVAADSFHEVNSWELAEHTVDHLIQTVRAEERERCAKMCYGLCTTGTGDNRLGDYDNGRNYGLHIAAKAIRAAGDE